MKEIVAVVGPTASGKTALAIEVAKLLDTEIVSADSMQFYRGMEIGTGAPSDEELAMVKHHFVGTLDPCERMSAGAYRLQASEVVRALNGLGKIAVVVGGSGLYLRALLDGLFDGPGADPDLRVRLEREAVEKGSEALHTRLAGVDPEYAATIHGNDLKRIVRGLEVFETSGTPLSALHIEQQETGFAFDSVQFALDFPRAELYARINRRVDGMLEAGFVEEVTRLRDAGYLSDISRLKSLGYREILAHLRGESSLEEAREMMKMNTRRYAKRQLTWFRGDTRIEWLKADTDETDASRAKHIVSTLLSG